MAKAGRKSSARGLARSRDEALEDALEIIEPAEHERDRCRGEIAEAVQDLAWYYANPGKLAADHPDSTESTKKIAQIAEVFSRAAALMNDPIMRELMKQDELVRLSDRLAAIARAAEQELARRPDPTKPRNEFKHQCAMRALWLLWEFNPRRATRERHVTLSQVLYEAATKIADEPFDWVCRQEIERGTAPEPQIEITDFDALFAYCAETPEMTRLIQRLAEEAVRRGVNVPGTIVTETKIAVWEG